jgi:hypothetical protein
MRSARRPWRAAVYAASLLLGPLGLGAGCTDALGSGAARVALAIVPDFGALAPFAANADQLHLVVIPVSNAAVVAVDGRARDAAGQGPPTGIERQAETERQRPPIR